MSEASQDTAKRLARIVTATAAWLDEQYIQLGKKTIPLFYEVDDGFKALTDEDRAFLRTAGKERLGAAGVAVETVEEEQIDGHHDKATHDDRGVGARAK